MKKKLRQPRRNKKSMCIAKVMLDFLPNDQCSFHVEAPVDGIEFTWHNVARSLAIGLETMVSKEEALRLVEFAYRPDRQKLLDS